MGCAQVVLLFKSASEFILTFLWLLEQIRTKESLKIRFAGRQNDFLSKDDPGSGLRNKKVWENVRTI